MKSRYNRSVRVRDLIALPRVKTVVQLQDAKDPEVSKLLVDNFVLTDEVYAGLRVILEHVSSLTGSGFFLKGHFGSGKSHFLAYLSVVLSDAKSFRSFIENCRKAKASDSLQLEGLKSRRVVVTPVSLVEFRSAAFLEDIVREKISEALPGFESQVPAAFESPENRRAFFERLFQHLREEGFEGLLVVMDELSEFLRSKAAIHDFNEDIRFLQFLGELSDHHPLWIVAALQEYLEETGEIHQELFNKIKDRYPVRIVLSAAHVKTLVRDFLIQKKPGARETVRAFFQELRAAFPDWGVSEDEFFHLYPVHPSSIDLLEDLKPLFSKTRGFVDFIHYQVGGDADRGIEGILDRPARTLVHPDRIFDHFLDRMKSTLEILPYIETVYAYYRKEIPRFLEKPEDRHFANRLVKLLILQEISPTRRTFTVRELSEMLLERITDVEPELNFRYTFEIGQELAKRGGFVLFQSTEQPIAQQKMKVELEASVISIVESKLEYQRVLLASLGEQVVPRLFPRLVERIPFFQGLRAGSREALVLEWQNSNRSGELEFLPDDFDSLQGEAGDAEFRLVVLSPGQPAPSTSGDGTPTGFLVPGPITGIERSREALALLELKKLYREDESTQGRKISEHIELRLKDVLAALAPGYQKSFEVGKVVSDRGEILRNEIGVGSASARQLFSAAAARLLEHRFPRHYLVAPKLSYYPQAALREMPPFFESMSSDEFKKLRWGRTVLEGFLIPTGIIKQKRNQYLFCESTSESPPLQFLMESIQGRATCSASNALSILAESEFGMGALQARAFLLAVLFGGFLQPFRSARRLALSQIDPDRLLEIEELRPGETVSGEALDQLRELEFISPAYRKNSLSSGECRLCWKEVLDFHAELLQARQQLTNQLERFGEYRFFRRLKAERLARALRSVEEVIQAVKVSRSPVEGLGGLARDLSSPGQVNAGLKDFKNAGDFFTNHFAGFIFAAGYLEQLEDRIPSEGRYAELRKLYAELRERFDEWDPCFGADPFERLQTAFERWRQLYIPLYQEEHVDFYRNEAFDQLSDLLESPALRLLTRLERLEAFVPEVSSGEIRGELSQALSRRCDRSVWEELQQRPLCVCGFVLGEGKPDLRPELAARRLERQLDQFAQQMQHPRFQELLDRFEFHAQQVASVPGLMESIEKLKRARSAKGLLAVESSLAAEVLERLNRFEPGRRPFQVKYLQAFRQRLKGAPRPRRALVDEFEAWLGEGVDDPEEAILLAEKPGQDLQSPASELNRILTDLAPSLIGELQKLSPEEIVFRALSCHLADRHQLDPELAKKHLPLFPSQNRIEAYLQAARAISSADLPWVEEIKRSFEERLSDSKLEALGLLADSIESNSSVVTRETTFPTVVRKAAQRLVRRLEHAGIQELEKFENLLEENRETSEENSDANRSTLALLRTLCRVRRSLLRLERLQQAPPRSRRAMERVFQESVADLPYLVDRLRVLRGQAGLSGEHGLEELCGQASGCLPWFNELFSRGIADQKDRLPRVPSRLQEQETN
ncbi:MAG TPA: DUF6079 family protein, partial [Acidobacteriota bacterium]|nr:DUF6079 family protein [Acidobacteriota bacterium]